MCGKNRYEGADPLLEEEERPRLAFSTCLAPDHLLQLFATPFRQ
ncbi:hypothetical protein SBA5_370013 [Candidatus Sulfotelmatomonas gaucii]|uniref:Uncharacterized protein n=1 Tax=Candidatus Sulfuritelmatomonas gaucii TaxID=2043161 RepID=A0A2N9LHV8_9BACT|nr:hypothetical protein SBA5_370013 [Candidatus Sulfotelmatomonas gaucii]